MFSAAFGARFHYCTLLLLAAGVAPACSLRDDATGDSQDQGATTDVTDSLHRALFDLYAPAAGATDSPARDAVIQATRSIQGLTALLTAFGHAIDTTGGAAFVALPRGQQEAHIAALATSSSNDARRLAMQVRNIYLAAIYSSPVGRPLTGAREVVLDNPGGAGFMSAQTPAFPPSKLKYNAQTHEVVHTGGEIDYLIVGSGPAGSVLAHELRRGGHRVVLLERGPFVLPGAVETRKPNWLRESGGLRTTDDGAVQVRAGYAVGGGTTVNVDLAFAPTLPFIKQKIASWHSSGLVPADRWSDDQMASAYAWVKSSVGTRTPLASEMNANNAVLWQGALAEGEQPAHYDLNTYAPHASPSPVTDKRSATSAFVLPAMLDQTNPLSLLSDTEAEAILFDDVGGVKQARGVRVHANAARTDYGVLKDVAGLNLPLNQPITIHAKNVVVSSSALATPALLLRSQVVNPLIGRGLIMHPSMPVIGQFDHKIDVLDGTPSTTYVYAEDRGFAFEAMSAEPAYAAAMVPGTGADVESAMRKFLDTAGFGVMLIDSVSPDNRVTIGTDGNPILHYTLQEADKTRFRTGIAEAVRIMFRAGAKRVILPTNEDIWKGCSVSVTAAHPLGTLASIDEAKCVEEKLTFVTNRTVLTSAHLQATMKMGPDAAHGVVGPDHAVWGTHGLYVVDGSVFPTSIGANPMQSIYTMAKVFADSQVGN